MSRVQVLDVGDRVQPSDTRLRHLAGETVVIGLDPREPDSYRLATTTGVVITAGRPGIERIGGNLQLGDWVKVQGRIEPTTTCDWTDVANAIGIIVDVYEDSDVDFVVAIPELNDLYECRTKDLTRITRAEALA
ncbi:hypothetical protein D3875_03055 [Deinococcus cavernae]|uniref:Uncharacterized protein n=1 Tax=Deinococcus cavernae TaxID=2320857 RepID=A0A418VG11_9DEIO|nr:hypothetical protein [Deinococcus cavernae]RJF74991.1 hypothetical protein D3875_03055 [Deinococcus cavernae]